MKKSLNDLFADNQLPPTLALIGRPEVVKETVEAFITTIKLNAADSYWQTEGPLKAQDVRQIRQFAELSRTTSPIKLIIIPDANQLTVEAANALLKILEEPPAHTHFILGVIYPDRLLPTVRSRCQLHYLEGQEGMQVDVSTEPMPDTTQLLPLFQTTKRLANNDLDLRALLEGWLQQETNPARQRIILSYLPLCRHNPQRRLLLDQLLLDLYTMKEL